MVHSQLLTDMCIDASSYGGLHDELRQASETVANARIRLGLSPKELWIEEFKLE